MFGNHHRIKLDKGLWEQVSLLAIERGYATVDEFVSHLLEREIRSHAEEPAKEKVLEKLKGLGYLQ